MKWRVESGILLPADAESRSFLCNQVCGGTIDLSEPEKIKTDAQRNSLHLWLRLVAELLNDAGYDMVLFLETINAEDTTIPCTMEGLKERFYKPVLKAMKNKDSTEDQSTTDPGEIYQTCCRILGEKFGITPPAWPSRHGDMAA